MDEKWMDDLRDAGQALRPTPDAFGKVEAGIRRRRRRRNAVATGGSAILVGAAVLGVAVLPGSGDDGSAGPVTISTPSASGLFECATRSKVFGSAPSLDDLTAQEAIVSDVAQTDFAGFSVELAEPTHLGVVALVNTSYEDLPAARQVLSERGVKHVYRWNPEMKQAGVDGPGQVQQALEWAMEPALEDVRRATRGVRGNGGLAIWQEAGAIVQQWKSPVPAKVRSLDGVREDGVEVMVEAVPYSSAEMQRAGNEVFDARQAGSLGDVELASSSGCADGTGLLVGVVPSSLGDRRAELQRELAAIAGMPVMVVPEERFQNLPGAGVGPQ